MSDQLKISYLQHYDISWLGSSPSNAESLGTIWLNIVGAWEKQNKLSKAVLFALTILTWKNLCFTEKIDWNTRLAASDVFVFFCFWGKVLLKKGTRDFQISPLFKRSTCFYVTISESFKRFQYFNFETNFLENAPLKTHHFHSKLLCQKPMLRQIEWRLQNGPITKSGVLLVKTFFFWKICSSFRTS